MRMSAVAVITLSAVLAVAVGSPEIANLVPIFMTTCPDGSVCPLNITEATIAQGEGREVAGECCAYFRGGCCTPTENQQLVTWFQVALGIGIGLPFFAALVLILFVFGCIYYKLRYANPQESTIEKDIFRSPATKTYSYWNRYANGSTERAIFQTKS